MRVLTGHVLHVPPYGKFAGILLIIWVALLYTADGAVRKLVRPVVHVSVPIMRGITRVVAILLTPFEWLIEMLPGMGMFG
jgi:hypothetical protein